MSHRRILVLVVLLLDSCCKFPSGRGRPADFSELINWSSNLVFATSPRDATDLLPFVIEVPEASIYKYELRSATGSLINDRQLCPRQLPGPNAPVIQGFPVNYGIVPGRFNEDGDPVDVLVLGQAELYQKMIAQHQLSVRAVRPVGLMRMQECESFPCQSEKHWLQDYKIVAVDSEDPQWANVRSIEDIPASKLAEMERYWSFYKGHQTINGQIFSFTRVQGFGDLIEAKKFLTQFKIYQPQERQQLVEQCLDYYDSLARSIDYDWDRPSDGKKFLACLDRVWPAPFFQAGPRAIDYFLHLSAFYLLQEKLGQQLPSVRHSLAAMQKRKDEHKKYFRFVGRDLPAPGTGSPIYEWVKTYERDEFCLQKPQQHYLTRPLIDLDRMLWPNQAPEL